MSITSAGIRQASRELVQEMRLSVLHHASCLRARKFRSRGPLQLHLGCGKNIKAGWVNVDLWCSAADLRLDLRERFPFPDNSASVVYSEHVFEHLEYPTEAHHFLRESIRVLMPGGRLTIGVPDTEWPIRAYVNDEKQYFQYARDRWHPKWCNTRMHNINFHFRQGREHKYAYDFETLEQVLNDAGFTGIVRRNYDQGLDSDPFQRQLGTLYVDAFRPNSAA